MKNVTAMNLLIYPLTKIRPTFWQSYLFSFVSNWQRPRWLCHWASCVNNKKKVLFPIWVLPEAGLVVPRLYSYLCHPSRLTSGSLSTAQCSSIAWGEVRIWVHQGRCCIFWAAWLGREYGGTLTWVNQWWKRVTVPRPRAFQLPMSGCPLTTHRLFPGTKYMVKSLPILFLFNVLQNMPVARKW